MVFINLSFCGVSSFRLIKTYARICFFYHIKFSKLLIKWIPSKLFFYQTLIVR